MNITFSIPSLSNCLALLSLIVLAILSCKPIIVAVGRTLSCFHRTVKKEPKLFLIWLCLVGLNPWCMSCIDRFGFIPHSESSGLQFFGVVVALTLMAATLLFTIGVIVTGWMEDK